ncbi:ribosomal protein S5 domain 2-type protein [Flagelloscypha sp. PMI_526]|nr:ribosomal protein S5 domain 2-type protein [Flagelloscypha sp. PMI_526]
MSNPTISLSKSEKSYISSGFISSTPSRADGRALDVYRPIFLETGTAPLANGSAKVNIGKNAHDHGGGTEIIAACKLEVENVGGDDEGVDGGRTLCHVTCSPAAYPHLSTNAIEDLAADLTNFVQTILGHPTLHPPDLAIIPGKKSWALHLDLLVISDSGNVYDALFMAAHSALWDLRVPRTQSIEFRQGGSTTDDIEMADEVQQQKSSLDTRNLNMTASDFELTDSWDEGAPLKGREKWPVCVTINLAPPTHYIDATLAEEAATPHKLLLVFSFEKLDLKLQGMQFMGPAELNMDQIKTLIPAGQKYAHTLYSGLQSKLLEEDSRRERRD